MADKEKSDEEMARDWQKLCETTVWTLSNLISAADRHRSSSAIIEMLRQIPRSLDSDQKIERDSLLGRCFTKAKENAVWAKRGERDFMDVIIKVAGLSKEERAGLEACVTGVLLGYDMGGK
jgi:hypothetical protein